MRVGPGAYLLLSALLFAIGVAGVRQQLEEGGDRDHEGGGNGQGGDPAGEGAQPLAEQHVDREAGQRQQRQQPDQADRAGSVQGTVTP